jgi:hypothetical protein
LGHPFKKTEVATPIALFPGYGIGWRDKETLFLSLDGERKIPSGKINRCLPTAWAPASQKVARPTVFFERYLTIDNTTQAHPGSLRHAQLRWILY